ncbi:hypothetical protein D5S19_21995 [Amycolatopsis panacis]|uniref:Uncharacterized protein n=1 Tax=Amycolatopsis panacis TaxID=2340917 RepID=A0A419HYZ1_9PSEU|nr:hypothetical protein D5S19_21995 [Amycolatopsis panacis]
MRHRAFSEPQIRRHRAVHEPGVRRRDRAAPRRPAGRARGFGGHGDADVRSRHLGRLPAPIAGGPRVFGVSLVIRLGFGLGRTDGRTAPCRWRALGVRGPTTASGRLFPCLATRTARRGLLGIRRAAAARLRKRLALVEETTRRSLFALVEQARTGRRKLLGFVHTTANGRHLLAFVHTTADGRR